MPTEWLISSKARDVCLTALASCRGARQWVEGGGPRLPLHSLQAPSGGLRHPRAPPPLHSPSVHRQSATATLGEPSPACSPGEAAKPWCSGHLAPVSPRPACGPGWAARSPAASLTLRGAARPRAPSGRGAAAPGRRAPTGTGAESPGPGPHAGGAGRPRRMQQPPPAPLRGGAGRGGAGRAAAEGEAAASGGGGGGGRRAGGGSGGGGGMVRKPRDKKRQRGEREAPESSSPRCARCRRPRPGSM